jgi:homoserine dehydrogenase
VSIRAAEQEGNGPDARLVFITHDAVEADVQATLRQLRDAPGRHTCCGSAASSV